jgi:hypothetical protein
MRIADLLEARDKFVKWFDLVDNYHFEEGSLTMTGFSRVTMRVVKKLISSAIACLS